MSTLNLTGEPRPADFDCWSAERRWDWLLEHGAPLFPWLWNASAREQWERSGEKRAQP